MNLQNLQDRLRAHIRVRIGRGELTGSALAHAAHFPQGHLSNFLHQRRGLSTESMDRLLDALGIGLLDLVEDHELQRRVVPAGSTSDPIALVAAEHAGLARFSPNQVLETRSFSRAFLRRLKPRTNEDRRDWLRFVLIKLDVRDLFPTENSSATLLIDRHYSSLQPYRRLRPNLYAIHLQGKCRMGYLSLFDDQLVLRTRNLHEEPGAVRIERGQPYSHYIIGRVCYLGLEV